MQEPAPRKKVNWMMRAAVALSVVLTVVITLAVVPKILGHYFWSIEQWYRVTPVQPIAFPHPSHVQVDGIDCLFCHRSVATDAMASIPPVQQCMFCHKLVKTDSPEIQKLAKYASDNVPVEWIRVHRVPDHVHFVHEAHITFFTRRDNVAPSQVCATCHGDVGSMQQVKQVRSLRMGDCVDCHRQNNAPTDCAVCHY